MILGLPEKALSNMDLYLMRSLKLDVIFVELTGLREVRDLSLIVFSL